VGVALQLADGRQARVEIIIPVDAHSALEIAARELRRCVERMCGARLQIRQAELPANSLLIRPPDQVEQELPDARVEADGYALLPVSGTLAVRARRPRGVLFGVYDLLQTLGCRWFEPGERGEIITAQNRPAVPLEARIESPRFTLRGLVHGYHPQLVEWMARNRFSATILSAERFDEIRESGALEALRARDMTAEFGHHDFKRYFIDPHDYFDHHPEWFGMRGGRRVAGYRGVCLCLTNREMEDQFAANVGRLLGDYPWLERVSIWPDDGLVACDCPRCAEDRSGERTISDHVLGFVNRIAERFPDRRFSHLVYQQTLREMPMRERPLPNVDFCAIEIDEDRLAVWRALLDHDQCAGERSDRALIIYGYWGGFSGSMAQTRHYPSELARALTDFEAAGVDGILTQSLFGYPTGYCTNMLLMADHGWRRRRAVDEVMSDYCRRGFGEYAGMFEDYLKAFDGRHGSIFRGISPSSGVARGFMEADNSFRAVLLGARRELAQTYEAWAPAMDEIPPELEATGLPFRLLAERVALDYNALAASAYSEALRGVNALASALSRQDEPMPLLRLGRAAERRLRRASRALEQAERERQRVVATLGGADPVTSDYFGLSKVGLDAQRADLAHLRRHQILQQAGIVTVRELLAERLEVADASEPAWHVEELAREAAGMDDAGSQLVFRPQSPGAWIELEVPVEEAGEHLLTFGVFREARMGSWRALVNGASAGEVDLRYKDFRMGSFYLGAHQLQDPSCRVRFELVGSDGDGTWLALSTLTISRHCGDAA